MSGIDMDHMDRPLAKYPVVDCNNEEVQLLFDIMNTDHQSKIMSYITTEWKLVRYSAHI